MRDLGVCVLLAVILLGGLPQSGRGQAIREGDRIRVTAPAILPSPQAGRLILLEATSLTFQSGRGRSTRPENRLVQHVIPRNALSLVEVSRGSQGHAGKGALIGAGIGLAIGLAVTGAGGSSICQGSGDYGEACAAMVLIGVVGGGLGGLVVGAAARSERWEPVALEGR